YVALARPITELARPTTTSATYYALDDRPTPTPCRLPGATGPILAAGVCRHKEVPVSPSGVVAGFDSAHRAEPGDAHPPMRPGREPPTVSAGRGEGRSSTQDLVDHRFSLLQQDLAPRPTPAACRPLVGGARRPFPGRRRRPQPRARRHPCLDRRPGARLGAVALLGVEVAAPRPDRVG